MCISEEEYNLVCERNQAKRRCINELIRLGNLMADAIKDEQGLTDEARDWLRYICGIVPIATAQGDSDNGN